MFENQYETLKTTKFEACQGAKNTEYGQNSLRNRLSFKKGEHLCCIH